MNTVWTFFVLDRNTLYHMTVCKNILETTLIM